MEEESDSFLDLLRLQPGLLWLNVINDLRRGSRHLADATLSLALAKRNEQEVFLYKKRYAWQKLPVQPLTNILVY